MGAQQELFTALLLAIKDLGYDVYDGYLPPEGTAYPFVYLADSQQVDSTAKAQVYGNVFQTIHVWHDTPARRGTVSAMMEKIKQVCLSIEHTDSHAWIMVNADQQILTDTTTTEPLLHGVLDVEYLYS